MAKPCKYNMWAPRICLLLLITVANAKPHRHIHRLGSISPIPTNSDGNNDNISRGPAEAWVETFSLINPKRATSTNNDMRSNEDVNREALVSKEVFASGIAFLAGASDVFSLRMTKSYANMMTGNVIKIASAIGERRLGEVLPCTSVVLGYALGCAIYGTMVNFSIRAEKSNPNAGARSTASLLLLALFALSDYFFYNPTNSNAWLVHMLPLALGFGLLNAASTDLLGGTITFAMTGHIGKVAQGLSEWVVDGKPWRAATKLSARILSFFVGGILGASWLASSGSSHVTIQATGLTLPAFLVGKNANLPIFTIVGVFAVALMHFHDWPLPSLLGGELKGATTQSDQPFVHGVQS